MIAVDSNLLVYAHREDSPFHAEALGKITSLAEGSAAWAIPWPCVHEFLSIVTHHRIYDPPTPLQRALEQVEAWLESPTLVLLAETEAHWPELRSVLQSSRTTGGRIHDARVAALCIQHRVTQLWTADRDFSRFPKLKVINPLGR